MAEIGENQWLTMNLEISLIKKEYKRKEQNKEEEKVWKKATNKDKQLGPRQSKDISKLYFNF